MSSEKVIVIGCDSQQHFWLVSNALESSDLFAYSLISVTRLTDLDKILTSVRCDILILCFRDNMQVLRDDHFMSSATGIPMLYLTMKFECDASFSKKNQIIFTYPFDKIHLKQAFCLRVQSIFLLKNAMKTVSSNTLAESARQHYSSGNNSDVSRYVMELDQKLELLHKVKERITVLYPNVDDLTRSELISIANTIKIASADTKLWDDFKIYFEQTNPNFLLTLARKHPELSPKDLKYCCYIKMNMSNNEITSLLGINQESVRTHKYRLKKKLVLPKGQNIVSYLRAVS